MLKRIVAGVAQTGRNADARWTFRVTPFGASLGTVASRRSATSHPDQRSDCSQDISRNATWHVVTPHLARPFPSHHNDFSRLLNVLWCEEVAMAMVLSGQSRLLVALCLTLLVLAGALAVGSFTGWFQPRHVTEPVPAKLRQVPPHPHLQCVSMFHCLMFK